MSPPRFSRKAVVGACWAPLFFIAFFTMFTAHVVPAGQYHKPEWWQSLLMFTLLPLGFTAPFGTTILGCVALSQIRRSAGKLYGLGLALFDALLFPLLALDFAGIKILLYSVEVLLRPVAQHHETARFLYHDAPLIFFIPAMLAILALDYTIIRRAWLAANKPVTDPSVSSTAVPPHTVRLGAGIAEEREAAGSMPAPPWPGHSARSLQAPFTSANQTVSDVPPVSPVPAQEGAGKRNKWIIGSVMAGAALVLIAGLFLVIWASNSKLSGLWGTRHYEIRKAAIPVTVDGNIEPNEWRDAVPVTPVQVDSDAGGEKTTIRVLYDPDWMYIAVSCVDSRITERNEDFSKNDSVRVDITTGWETEDFCRFDFAAVPQGLVAARFRKGLFTSLMDESADLTKALDPSFYKCGCVATHGGWSMELALARSAIGPAPAPPNDIQISVERRNLNDDKIEVADWPYDQKIRFLFETRTGVRGLLRFLGIAKSQSPIEQPPGLEVHQEAPLMFTGLFVLAMLVVCVPLCFILIRRRSRAARKPDGITVRSADIPPNPVRSGQGPVAEGSGQDARATVARASCPPPLFTSATASEKPTILDNPSATMLSNIPTPPAPRSNMHGRRVMLTGALMALIGFGAAILLRMIGAGHPGANHAIVFVAHPLAFVGFCVMLVGSLMARSSMKAKPVQSEQEQGGLNPPEGMDGLPAQSLPAPVGMGAASSLGRAGVNQSHSTSAILACVLVAVAATLLLVLPRALPAQSNFDAMLRWLWTVMIAGGVWAVACILTLVSVMRACYRKCNWRWPKAAVSLCVVLPAVFGIWCCWPSQDRMVHAAACGNQRVVSLALWLGCDINAPLKYGLGFNPVNAPLRNGQTALTAAIRGRQESMIPFLIARGADVNRPDGEDQTPLMAAVISGAPELVDRLLHAGAKPSPSIVDCAVLLLEQCHNGLRVREELPARQKIVALLQASEATPQHAAPTRRIRVTLDRTRMAVLGLTVEEVRAALTASGPGREQDLQSVIIKNRNGNLVRLQDIATIRLEEAGQGGPLKDNEIVIPEATGQRAPQSDPASPGSNNNTAAEIPGELKELNLTKEQAGQVMRWLQQHPQRPNPAAYARFVESILHDDQKATFRKMMAAGGSSPQNH